MKQLDPNAPAYPAEADHKDGEIMPAFQNGNTTALYRGLTAKQHACIQLELPESGVTWLDELIRKKQLQTLAGQAMQGVVLVSNQTLTMVECAEISMDIADAFLNELNKEVKDGN